MDARRRLAALPDAHGTPQLLTVDEAGQRLHCSRRKVFRLIESGDLPSVRIGRRRMVAAEDVTAYVDRLRAAAT